MQSPISLSGTLYLKKPQKTTLDDDYLSLLNQRVQHSTSANYTAIKKKKNPTVTILLEHSMVKSNR